MGIAGPRPARRLRVGSHAGAITPPLLLHSRIHDFTIFATTYAFFSLTTSSHLFNALLAHSLTRC